MCGGGGGVACVVVGKLMGRHYNVTTLDSQCQESQNNLLVIEYQDLPHRWGTTGIGYKDIAII